MSARLTAGPSPAGAAPVSMAIAGLALLSAFVQGFSLLSLTLLTAATLGVLAVELLAHHGAGTRFAPGVYGACMLLLAIWLVVAAQVSAVPGVARLGVYQPLLLPLAFLAMAIAPDQDLAWRRLRVSVAVLACLIALLALAEPLWSAAPSFSGVFVQRNSLSGYLVLVAFTIAPQLRIGDGGPKPPMQWLWRAAVFLAFFFICFSASRGAIGALAVAVAGLYVSMPRDERRARGRLMLAFALWAFLLADLALKGGATESIATVREAAVSAAQGFEGGRWATTAFRQEALTSARTFEQAKLSSANERLLIWTASVEMIRSGPWHGYGPGTFRVVYPSFGAPEDTSSRTYAHNDLLQAAVELGAPGVALALLLVLVVAMRYRAHRRRVDSRSLESDALCWALAGTAAHSAFTYNFHVPATLVMCGFVLARFDRLTRGPAPARRSLPALPELLGRRLFAALLLAAGLGTLAPLGAATAMAAYYERGVASLAAGRLTEASRDLGRAAVLSPNALAAVAQAQTYLSAFESSGETRLLEVVQERLEAAGRMNPYSPDVPYTRLLLALRVPGLGPEQRAALARTAYVDTLLLDNRYFPARLELARFLLAGERPDEALAVLESGLRQPIPDHPLALDYFELLASLRRASGDELGAIEIERRGVSLVQRLGDRT